MAWFPIAVSGAGSDQGNFDAAEFGPAAIWFQADHGVVEEGGFVKYWEAKLGGIRLKPLKGQAGPRLEPGPNTLPAIYFVPDTALVGRFNGELNREKTFVLVTEPMLNPELKGQAQGLLMFFYQHGISMEQGSGKLNFISRNPPEESLAKSLDPIRLRLRGVGTPGLLYAPSIIVVVLGPKHTKITVNGEEIYSEAIAFGTKIGGDTPFALGSTATIDAKAMVGTISEAIVYSEPLADEARKRLEKALGLKYAISVK